MITKTFGPGGPVRLVLASGEGVPERVALLSAKQVEIFKNVKNCGDVEAACYAASGRDKSIGDIHGPVFRDTKNCGPEATTALVLQSVRGERSIELARAEYARIFRDTQKCGEVASAILVSIGQAVDPKVVRDTYARIYREKGCGDVATAILTKLVLANKADETQVRTLFRDIYGGRRGDTASALFVREAVLNKTPAETLRTLFAKAYPVCKDDVATALCVLTSLRTQTPIDAVAQTASRIFADVKNCGYIASAVIAGAAYLNPDMPALMDGALGEQLAERKRREEQPPPPTV